MRDPDYNSSSSSTPAPTGYAALSQADLRKEIAYLEGLRSTSRNTSDSHGNWRVGEELSVAKLYLKNDPPEENPPKEDNPPQIVYSASLVVAPTPPTPAPVAAAPVVPIIKTATPQYILPGEDVMPVEIITDLIFENIGGQEILSLARHDLISGDYIPQQLIANVKKINNEYDPKNMFISQTSNKYFANFAIKLNTKVPNVGNGPDGSNVYVDTDGGIVVEFIDIKPDEQADIQITTSGTIYEVIN